MSVLALAAMVLLTACAGVSTESARIDVERLLVDRGYDADVEGEQWLADRLASPLSAQDAVRIAVANNPGLQRVYAKLGWGAADVYRAGRIRNPVLSAVVLESDAASESEKITLGIVTSLTDLITLSSRKRMSTTAYAALKQSVGAEVLMLAANTERHFYEYAAALQQLSLRRQVSHAAGLSAGLAERFESAGNLSERQLAEANAKRIAAKLAEFDAERDVSLRRAELANLLGLSAAEPWAIQRGLPVSRSTSQSLADTLQLARMQRLDLESSRTRVEYTADRFGVTDWERWLDDANLTYEHERDADGSARHGPGFEVSLPIFSQGRDKLLRANAELESAVAEFREVALRVENDVYLAHEQLQLSEARLLEVRDHLLPVHAEIVDRAQEEQGFMLLGVFELIEIKQSEYLSFETYLQALLEHRLAIVAVAEAAGGAVSEQSHNDDYVFDINEIVSDSSNNTNGGPRTTDHRHHMEESQ